MLHLGERLRPFVCVRSTPMTPHRLSCFGLPLFIAPGARAFELGVCRPRVSPNAAVPSCPQADVAYPCAKHALSLTVGCGCHVAEPLCRHGCSLLSRFCGRRGLLWVPVMSWPRGQAGAGRGQAGGVSGLGLGVSDWGTSRCTCGCCSCPGGCLPAQCAVLPGGFPAPLAGQSEPLCVGRSRKQGLCVGLP